MTRLPAPFTFLAHRPAPSPSPDHPHPRKDAR